jgi:hypothetical protein
MKLLEAEERTLQGTKEQHDAEAMRQTAILENLNNLTPPSQFQLDQRPVARLIQLIAERFAKNEQQLAGSFVE